MTHWPVRMCDVTDFKVCAMTHWYVRRDWFQGACRDLLILECYSFTHWHVWHRKDSFMRHACQVIHLCDMTHSSVWHDSFICVPWLIHLCDMTHSSVWHDPFICVPWLIHMCAMTHSYVCHDLTWHACLMNEAWGMRDMTQDLCVTWLVGMCAGVTWLIRDAHMSMSHATSHS